MAVTEKAAFPFPGFNAADTSTGDFHDFLKSVLDDSLLQDTAERVPFEKREAWVVLVSGLSDHFLTGLPSLGFVDWDGMDEKVGFVLTTLEIIQRVSLRVQGVFCGNGDLAKSIFSRLLNMGCVLQLWVAAEVPRRDHIPSPETLRTATMQTINRVLWSLGGANGALSASEGVEHGEIALETLRDVGKECLAQIAGQSSRLDVDVWVFESLFRSNSTKDRPFDVSYDSDTIPTPSSKGGQPGGPRTGTSDTFCIRL